MYMLLCTAILSLENLSFLTAGFKKNFYTVQLHYCNSHAARLKELLSK